MKSCKKMWVIARRILGCEQGGTLVEMAYVLPIAMFVFTGLLQSGVYINNTLELQNATSLAGEYLSENRQPAATSWDPCNITVTAFKSVSPFLNSSNATFSFVFTTPTGTVGTFSNSTSCPTGYADIVQGATAQILVTYPCSVAVYGSNLVPSCKLQAQVTEVIQ